MGLRDKFSALALWALAGRSPSDGQTEPAEQTAPVEPEKATPKAARIEFKNAADMLRTNKFSEAAALLTSLDNKEALEALIDQGVVSVDHIFVYSNSQEFLLFHAAREGAINVVGMLVSKGAKVDAVTVDGRTALTAAVENKDINMVRLLLDSGANPSGPKKHINTDEKYAILKHGWSPLHYIAGFKHTDVDETCLAIATLLIERGADVNLKVSSDLSHGYTPAHFAANANNMDIAKLLVSRGVNLDIRSSVHKNRADEIGHNDVSRYFKDVISMTQDQLLQVIRDLPKPAATREPA